MFSLSEVWKWENEMNRKNHLSSGVTVFAVALFLFMFLTVLACDSNEEAKVEKVKESIDYPTERQIDRNAPINYGAPDDSTVVKQEGINGEKEVTYEVTYLNGKVAMREKISEEIIKEPVPKIIIRARFPWEAPSQATVDLSIDIHSLIGKSENELNTTLGQSTSIPAAWGADCPSCKRNVYQTNMGRITVTFANGKSYWIIIDGLKDVGFSKENLTSIGIKDPLEPDTASPGFFEWHNIDGIHYLALIGTDISDNIADKSIQSIDYISFCGEFSGGHPLFPVNPTGRLDTPDTYVALCYENFKIYHPQT